MPKKEVSGVKMCTMLGLNENKRRSENKRTVKNKRGEQRCLKGENHTQRPETQHAHKMHKLQLWTGKY